MPISQPNRYPVGSQKDPRGLLKQLGFSDAEVEARTKNIPRFDLSMAKLEEMLSRDLGAEGFHFQIEPNNKLEGGFVRVYVSKAGEIHPSSYLDLRIGGNTPMGPAIHMGVTKDNTFGIPGFTRLVGAEPKTTISTLEDFIRAYHARAERFGKSPQETIWQTYQEGDVSFNLPGAGEALTPSSTTGQIAYQEKIVRYQVPENWPGSPGMDQEKRYLTWVASNIGQGNLTSLYGYVPEPSKWKNLVPGSQFAWVNRSSETGLLNPLSQVVRGVGSEFKSLSTVREARNLATAPMIWDAKAKRMVQLPASDIETGPMSKRAMLTQGGIRKGFVKSSVILPGESAPRNVLTQRVALAETADLPGAALVSPSAFNVSVGGPDEYPIYGMGERMNILAELNISNARDLEKILAQPHGGLKVFDTLGRVMRQGKSQREVGRIYTGVNDQGEEQYRPILAQRRGYDVRLGLPNIHIPQYMNPQTGEFSNIIGPGLVETTALQETLRKRLKANVVGYSSQGMGDEENPAMMYMNIPAWGLSPAAIKTGGFKASPTPVDQMQMNLLGVSGSQAIDILTQEAKVPSRVLMESFGIMRPQAQYSFLREFGGSKEGASAAIEYMKSQYNAETFQGIDLEHLADVFHAAMKGENQPEFFSADIMFANMFNRVLSVSDPKKARMMWQKYGIGLPEDQMMKTTTYSKSEMLNMEALVKEMGLQGKITFERVPGTKRELYRMSQAVVGGGKSVVMFSGLSFTPEYQSNSGYIGYKSIMSMAESFPEISKSMGLLSPYEQNGQDVMAFTGPNLLDQPDAAGIVPSRQGWMDLWSWAGFQQDLNQLKPNIPNNTVELTPELASEMHAALTDAGMEDTSKARLEKFKENLRAIDKTALGIEPNVDLTNTFFIDPVGTLLPKLSSIENVESYNTLDETRTYLGDTYLRLVNAAVQSTVSESDVAYDRVLGVRDRFFNRIKSKFVQAPGTQGSKKIYRNVYGVELPGTRGGRYMSITGLDTVEAAADEDYVRAMLTNGKFVDPSEVDNIVKWLKSDDPNAYLPVLTQRFPDVSGTNVWMPMKLRLTDWMVRQGVNIPDRKLGSRGVFYMSQTANRFFIGDFDADPAMQKLVPISKQGAGWKADSPAAQAEFDKGIAAYAGAGDALNRSLTRMFGPMGASTGSSTLDAQRANLREYMEAVMQGKGSLTKRLRPTDPLTGSGAVGPVGMMELLSAAMGVKHFKTGMGVAYNRRTLTEDIMDMVLTHTGGDPANEQVRQNAYESGAFNYQMYLDRESFAAGDYSPLETMLNTIGVYQYTDRGAEGMDYAVSFKPSEQGKSVEIPLNYDPSKKQKGPPWVVSHRPGFVDGGFMLRALISNLSKERTYTNAEGEEFPIGLTNAQLAYGFSSKGNAAKVFDVLEKGAVDPTSGNPRSRATLLRNMFTQGLVGLDSPYYMAALYSMVRRAQDKDPKLLMDNRVKLPWITGEILSLSEIADKKEFKAADVLKKLFVEGRSIAGADEMEQLANMGMTRLGKHALGVYREWMASTGGNAPTTEAAQKLTQTYANLGQRIGERMMQANPTVHASEMGALMWDAANQEWTLPKDYVSRFTQYEAIMRWMNLPMVFGDRESQFAMFKRPDWQHISEDIGAPSDIEKGNIFEARYAQTGQYHHVGQVNREPGDVGLINKKNLTFSVGGLTVTGVPDFVDFDEKHGNLVIVDTKLAQKDPWQSPSVMARVKSYKNRMQQIGYAYGLEQTARTKTEEDWFNLMEGWGFDRMNDRDKILNMRRSAAQGRFSISLLPGNAVGPNMQTFDAIPIPYGDREKLEYEKIAEAIRKNIFGTSFVQKISADVFQAVSQEYGMPSGLPGSIERTRYKPEAGTFSLLEQFAKAPVTRAAGGGIFGDKPLRMRVGEGGPEDLEISNGKVRVIPEQHGYRPGFGPPRFAEGGDFNFTTGWPGGNPNSEDPMVQQMRAQAEAAKNAPRQPFEGTDPGALIDAFNHLSGILEAWTPATIKLDLGPRTQPSPFEIGTKLMKSSFNTQEFMSSVGGFERSVRTTLLDIFKQNGIEGLAQGMENVPSAADLLSLAQGQLEPEQYLPQLSKYVKQSKQLTKQGAGFAFLNKFMQLKAGGNRAYQDVFEQLPQNLQGAMETAYEEISSNRAGFEQGGGVAAVLSQGKGFSELLTSNKLEGVDQKLVSDWIDSIREATKATQTLADSQGNLGKQTEALMGQRRADISQDIRSAQIRQRVAAIQGGRFFNPQTGEWKAPEEIGGMQPTPEEQVGINQYRAATEELATARRRQAQMSGSGLVRGVQGLARGFLGGWGLMYVGTLAGMGNAAYAEGYQQFEESQMARSQAMARYFGPGIGLGDRTEQIYQAALSRGGNIPYRQMRQMQAVVAGTGLTDISGALQKGLGMGALSLFAGNLALEAGTQAGLGGLISAGTGLAAAALPIAAVVGAGALAYNQWAYAQNPVETATQVASSRMRQQTYQQQGNFVGAAVEGIGSWYKGLSTTEYKPTGEWLQSPLQQVDIANNPVIWSNPLNPVRRVFGLPEIQQLQYQETQAQAYERLTKAAQAQGTFQGINQTELGGVVSVIANQQWAEKFGGGTSQAVWQAIGMAGEAGQLGNQDLLEKIASGYSLGLTYDQTAQSLNQLRGGGLPTAKNLSQLVTTFAQNGYSQDQLTRFEAAANFIQNLPEDTFKISATQDAQDFVTALNEASKRYENVIGTLKEQPVARALQASQLAEAMGINVNGLNAQTNQILNLPQNQAMTAEQQNQLLAGTVYAENQQNYWLQTQSRMQGQGIGLTQAGNYTRQLAPYGARGQAWATGLLGGNPLFWTAAAAQGVDLSQYYTQDAFGRYTTMNDLAVSDINQQGQVTGLPLYSTSLRRGSISAETNATNIFGVNWMARDPYFYRRGATSGGVVPGYEQFGEVGGSRWLQLTEANLRNEYQAQTNALNTQQQALTFAFTTGVGIGNYNPTNPQTGQNFGFNTGNFSFNIPGLGGYQSQGGGFWGLEDAQRALQNMQTVYGLNMAQRQMNLQTSQFQENTALQRQGQLMQRGWTQQDWAYQSNLRAMQWGWQMSDTQENMRFMTGRDRQQAERQLQRQTIMYGMEGEQIDRQHQRQKETWRLEDEQYRLQIKHFNETKALQEEANRMNRVFYDEQKKMIDESTKMQRAYWTEQQALQQRATAANQEYAAKVADLNKVQMEMGLSAGDATAQANLLNAALTDLEKIFGNIIETLTANGTLGEPDNSGNNTGTSTPTPDHKEGDPVKGDPQSYWHWDGTKWVTKRGVPGLATGGHMFAGDTRVVNENGGELFSPDSSGTVIPLSNLNPWASNVIIPGAGGQQVSHSSRIAIYIGNHLLKEVIIDTLDKEIRI